VSRALSEGYRTVLPHGVYPAALLFLEVPLEEVDVNVHPAKTEVRFRRAPAVAEAVREAVRGALAAGGYVRRADEPDERRVETQSPGEFANFDRAGVEASGGDAAWRAKSEAQLPQQEPMEFGFTPPTDEELLLSSQEFAERAQSLPPPARAALDTMERNAGTATPEREEYIDVRGANDPDASMLATDERARGREAQGDEARLRADNELRTEAGARDLNSSAPAPSQGSASSLPPLNSIAGAMYEVEVEAISNNIRPLYQLEESYIIAIDAEGVLLIDQHAAHERVLFDKYRKLEQTRAAESQALLMPETFDLTPAQAAAFDTVAEELETYGFSLMRLSGRTVAVKAVPADLPATEARNMLAEVLETVEAERRGTLRETLRERVAASLACHAAIKVNMPLAIEKMRWLIDRLLTTSSPTTCPHGRPAILRLTTRDIERGFHRP
jgi:DNA mismatch repair protein MutL